jgi:6-phosphogluconolactonase
MTVTDAPAEATDTCARRVKAAIEAAIHNHGAAHFALAGGNTPKATYEELHTLIEDWSRVHLWFGDERSVPPDDPDSNYLMVKQTLLNEINIPADQVHRVLGELGSEQAAQRYSQEMLTVIGDEGGVPILDINLLGLGEDGHTASLFPNQATLRARGQVCLPVHNSPKPPPDRVTLSLDVLRDARQTIILATGSGKAAAVAGIMAGPSEEFPASLVAGSRTELLVDREAAAQTQ